MARRYAWTARSECSPANDALQHVTRYAGEIWGVCQRDSGPRNACVCVELDGLTSREPKGSQSAGKCPEARNINYIPE